MSRSIRRSARLIQFGIGTRCDQQTIAERLDRGIDQESAAKCARTDIPSVVCHEIGSGKILPLFLRPLFRFAFLILAFSSSEFACVQSPFVVISVVGQELLQAGQYQAAVTVLEAALRIGTCSLKLRGSVFSALSSAYWALNQLDKAIGYMQQDLAVAKSLGE